MKITLTAMSKKERVSTRTGKPFTSLGIKTQEHGDKWLSGFAGKENADWKVGDTVEIEIVEKGEYLNFSVPKKEDMGPAANSAATAEIMNFLKFKIEPQLDAIWGRLGLILKNQEMTVEDDKEDEIPYPEF